MCGIVGLLTAERNASIAMCDAMTSSLAHRGPDDSGSFLSQSTELFLGHRRLSVIDLTPTGIQPMSSRSGRWTTVLNGEIYNHRDLRQELRHSGTSFRGTSDTETLIEAVDRWGVESTLRRLEGMFAVAFWDAAERHLWLARDRLGEKPLYWTSNGRRLAFASELRGLRTLADVPLEVDERSASALLRWSFIPHPHTIYKDVLQLAPGTLVSARISRDQVDVSLAEWWSLSETIHTSRHDARHISLGEAAHELEAHLSRSVAQRIESDVEIAAFLSGGIDSTLVAAMAQRSLGSHQLSTFTVQLPGSPIDETGEAERVSRWLGTNHATIELGPSQALQMVEKMTSIWDEPFADPSMLPTALVCSAASERATVCLGGDGGDEVLAGYNRHALGASVGRAASLLPRPLRSGVAAMGRGRFPTIVERVANRLPGTAIPHLADKLRKAAALVDEGGDPWATLVGIWPRSELRVAPHEPAFGSSYDDLGPVERLIAADTATVLPDQMLVKVDRASMAYGLEVRSPFLDTALLTWAWGLPLQHRTTGGVGKVVARELARQLLPPGMSSRRKRGFDPPLASWLRVELREWAEELLRDPIVTRMNLIDQSSIRVTWDRHLRGAANEEYRLWGILMLESWLRTPGYADR